MKHSNERIFQVMIVSIRSIVLPVMANIAQSLVGDLERIRPTMANPGGVQGVRPTLPAIRYSMKMK